MGVEKMTESPKTIIQVRDLEKHFPIRGGFFRTVQAHVKAVDGVNFDIHRGQTLGLVGESGCGKTTLGRTLLRLIEPTKGKIIFDGEDLTALPTAALKEKRRDMQIIFQDPFASLNPRMTVREIIDEPMFTHKIGTKQEREKKVKRLETASCRTVLRSAARSCWRLREGSPSAPARSSYAD